MPPGYCAGGDSFGSILGDIFRGVASNPRGPVRGVVSDLLDVLEATAEPDVRTSFATAGEWRAAVADAESLEARLEKMLRDDVGPALADAKAAEKAARVDPKSDVDDLLSKIEAAAGLDAKKRACEKQIRNARREVEVLRRAGPPAAGGAGDAPPRDRPSASSLSPRGYVSNESRPRRG